MLRFYGPVNPMGSCRARSVYLTTRLLGRLSPLSGYSFARNWQLPFLNQRKGENDHWKYFMINLHESLLPCSAGVEPATSWSPVGRASNWATETGYFFHYTLWGSAWYRLLNILLYSSRLGTFFNRKIHVLIILLFSMKTYVMVLIRSASTRRF